ncbi:hypothetical protein RRG08_022894 [Elysia crispata]|uniref:Uncharacterized protein n=1 Tax=Elysia crispata TaxID=231223 RepID=A0AAE0XN39_9GAST|nr:hypothetical protein RRG08_022894 [Elysia crispata]
MSSLLGLERVLGLPERSTSCQNSPPCLQAYSEKNLLRDAVQRNDREAVCKILPTKIHCIQLAVNACMDEMTPESSMLEQLVNLVTEMKDRFEKTCPGYTLPRNRSPSGIYPNSRSILTALAAAVISMVFSHGSRVWRHLVWQGT